MQLFELIFDVRYRPHEGYRFMFEYFDETRVRCLRFTPRYFTQHTQLFYPLVYFFFEHTFALIFPTQ